ncbi:MAG: hypothetical protein SCK57_12935 [Bacillota bacterium]|nr:hypothetical protein [Bacillota bacterium]MDW7678559.1 hypothetical protein [Bacillota bacterium]
MFFIHLKNNKGSALLTIIVVMAVLIILGFSILSTSVSEGKQAVHHANKIQSKYLARTAVDDVAYAIIEDPENYSYSGYDTWSSANTPGMSYDVEVLENVAFPVPGYSNVTGYNIIGTGYVNNARSRVSLGVIKATIQMAVDSALYSMNDIDISNMEVNGIVTSLGGVSYHPIKNDGTGIVSYATVPEAERDASLFGSLFEQVIKYYFYYDDDEGKIDYYLGFEPGRIGGTFSYDGIYNDTYLREMDFITDPSELNGEDAGELNGDDIPIEDGTATISTNGYYNSIDLKDTGVKKLVFDTTGLTEPLDVVVNDLRVNSSGDIEIKGDGHLRLFIKDNLYVQGNFEVDNTGENPTFVELFAVGNAYIDFQTPIQYAEETFRINTDDEGNEYLLESDKNPSARILLDAGSTIDLQANGDFNAYIIGPGATIKITSSDTTVNGFVIGDIFTGTGVKPAGVINYVAPDDDLWKNLNLPWIKYFYQELA